MGTVRRQHLTRLPLWKLLYNSSSVLYTVTSSDFSNSLPPLGHVAMSGDITDGHNLKGDM